jgi:hypothetical protein
MSQSAAASAFARLAHQHRQQIDAEAHVAGLDDAGMARGGMQLSVSSSLGVHAGGADDVDNAGLGGRSANSSVAWGAVKSSTPSALAKPAARRLDPTPFGPSPASAPASLPAFPIPAARWQPARCAPSISAMARIKRLAHAAGRSNDDQFPMLLRLVLMSCLPFSVSSSAGGAASEARPPASLKACSVRKGRRWCRSVRGDYRSRPPARLHDDDLVGLGDGRQPVGDDQNRAVAP